MIVFQEVPDEITLAFNITNCPRRCEGCHSPQLRKDIGMELTIEVVETTLERHPHTTCIAFMGGDAQQDQIVKLAKKIRSLYPKLKLAFYSGHQ